MPAELAILIANRRAEIERLSRRVELLEAEIRGIELARDAIGAAVPPAPAPSSPPAPGNPAPTLRLDSRTGAEGISDPTHAGQEPRTVGRRLGSITTGSQNKLREAYRRYGGAGFSDEQYGRLIEGLGFRAKPSDIERQLTAFEQAGYVEAAGGGRRRVTERAAEAFGFDADEGARGERPEPATDSEGFRDAGADASPGFPDRDQAPSGAEPEGDLGAVGEGGESPDAPSPRPTATHTPAGPG